ncbi:MAG TPA: serine/threonine-protein kinase [Polyangia bacterium]|nr:serine/threonine-protein kinase [Polyangia bacterium]
MSAVAPLAGHSHRIGRYEPIRRLAVGGMAEIYLARLPGVGIEGFEKLVVLKRILPQHALDPELLRMFVDEARLSATLTHPHVTEVHDVGTDGDAPFFAMEYVHGANLRELLRAHARAAGRPVAPLQLAHAIGIVAAAADGLHYAHERLGPRDEPLEIVHRDVSPSNVLVSYDGAVKVSDFGIAKWAYQRTRTQEGTLKGKFAYMSPEQCRGRTVDRRSDVFALGTILYELTTGSPPFSGDSDLEILNWIATGVAAPPAWPEEAGEYPAALAAIVMRALAPDPAHRFPTMQALQIALEAFAREASLPVSTVALGGLMQELFADELAAWRAAEREGKSLAEHLAARPAPIRSSGNDDERTATDAFGPTRRRVSARRRWTSVLALTGFACVFAFAGGLAARIWKTSAERAAARSGTTSARAEPATRAASEVAAKPAMAIPSPTTTITAAPPAAPTATPTAITTTAPPVASRSRHRRPRAVAAPVATPHPSGESRLGAWDPDSPVPP